MQTLREFYFYKINILNKNSKNNKDSNHARMDFKGNKLNLMSI